MHHHREDSKTASRIAGAGDRLLWACVGVVFAILVASCAVDAEVMASAEQSPAPAISAAAQQSDPPTTEPTPSAPTPAAPAIATTPVQDMRQVLVVTEVIPRGMSVMELMQTPTLFLSARALPRDEVLPGAIHSVADLQELTGLVLAADRQPGEQLLRSNFRDPSDFSPQAAAPSPNALVDVPAGHGIEVVVLPSSRAVQGLIRAGELVRVVATSVEPDGQATSTTLLEAVEVVGFETLLPAGATTFEEQRDYAITIAVTPDEASKLSAALADSAILTLAGVPPTPDRFDVAIEMTDAQALDGRVRAGDVVNIVAVADSSLLASDAAVLSVSFGLGVASPTYSIIVSVTEGELLAVTTAMVTGQVALAEP